MSAQDLVFAAVLVARLLVPLAIPRFPLPGILAALVIDAADQTIFQAAGADADTGGYQSYDKAFDVYYLTIAYVSTFRNWSDPAARSLGRALFYYRLVGVVAFELSGARPLLIIFPNTFEYFFIVYEVIRLRWDPARLRRRDLITLAAAIWIVIKLPQEWWIHIARLDVTDVIAEHDWVLPALAVAAAGLAPVVVRLARRLPPADRPMTFDADAHVRRPEPETLVPWVLGDSLWTRALLEKVVLVAMVSIVFAHVLPGVRATDVQLTAAVATIVVLNAAVSEWRVRRGARWATTLTQFVAMAAVNGGILVGLWLAPGLDVSFRLGGSLFVVLLLTLIVTMYERYRSIGAGSSPLPAPGPRVAPD